MEKTRTYLFRAILVAASLFLVALGIALSNARIELTESGTHKRLLVPLGNAMLGIHTYAGTGDTVRMPGVLDGPVVRRLPDGSWAASWYCDDKVQQLTGTAGDLLIDCGGKRQVFLVSRTPVVPDAVSIRPATR